MKRLTLLYTAFALMVLISVPTLAYNENILKIFGESSVHEVDEVTCNGVKKAPTGTVWTGCSDYKTQEIWIKKDLPEKRKDEIFWHEFGHLLVGTTDPIAKIIYSQNFIKKDGYHDQTWRENAAVYTEKLFTGDIEPNVQFAYIGYLFTAKLLTYLQR